MARSARLSLSKPVCGRQAHLMICVCVVSCVVHSFIICQSIKRTHTGSFPLLLHIYRPPFLILLARSSLHLPIIITMRLTLALAALSCLAGNVQAFLLPKPAVQRYVLFVF